MLEENSRDRIITKPEQGVSLLIYGKPCLKANPLTKLITTRSNNPQKSTRRISVTITQSENTSHLLKTKNKKTKRINLRLGHTVQNFQQFLNYTFKCNLKNQIVQSSVTLKFCATISGVGTLSFHHNTSQLQKQKNQPTNKILVDTRCKILSNFEITQV